MHFDEVKELVLQKLKKELKPNLYYHNFQHTLDVCESVDRLAEMENIRGEEFVLLQTAALFHDTGFIWRYENNEELACNYARQILGDFNYSPAQTDHICNMIMSTQIPQQPEDIMGMILCDADLDYIGRGDFFITALRLHREWSENSNVKITFKDWYLKQQSFIIQHDFFTPSARELRNEKKAHNLAQVRELLLLLDATANDQLGSLSKTYK
ncbi:MAG: HD domain-containing protein [Bacteroidetes bacterium]|nr:MAG: HD domain-containing protein [Bacteroidota bacterium]